MQEHAQACGGVGEALHCRGRTVPVSPTHNLGPRPSPLPRAGRRVVQSIDLWLVSRGYLMTPMKYSDRQLAGLSARPPDRVELTARALSATGPAPASAEG